MGFDPSLVQNQDEANNFLCTICLEIVKDPVRCNICKNMFCDSCINEWQEMEKPCPFKCSSSITLINLSDEEMNCYYKIKIKCFKDYEKLICLDQLEFHLSICGLKNCVNYNLCNEKARYEIDGEKVCSQVCSDLLKLKTTNNRSKETIYKFIRYFKFFKNKMQLQFLNPENDFIRKGYRLLK